MYKLNHFCSTSCMCGPPYVLCSSSRVSVWCSQVKDKIFMARTVSEQSDQFGITESYIRKSSI